MTGVNDETAEQCPHEMFWGRCELVAGHKGDHDNDPALAALRTELREGGSRG